MSEHTAVDALHAEFMGSLAEGEARVCPVCERYASLYKRAINKSMAIGLAVFASEFDVGTWVDIPEWKASRGLWQSNDAAQLRHWGLLDAQADRVKRSNMAVDSPDHPMVGVWCLTSRGLAFTQGRLAVPRFAVLYNQKCLGLVGESITIREVRGFRFEDLPVDPETLSVLMGESA